MRLFIAGALSASLALISPANGAPSQDEFPVVDLEYARHKPTDVTTTEGGLRVAKYSNIRFAQPPTGDLRFRKPQTPPPAQPGTSNGTEHPVTDCVNSVPADVPFPGMNGTHWGQEDCLFLDVYVPEGVKPGDDVPVLHYIHGGAFAFGSKDNTLTTPPPWGLLDAAESVSKKFIFVANNHRTGLYGWASSPHESTMDANVGVHDNLAAVDWTKQHVSKFGGDPDGITVFGQSEGAAIINVMLTAYGGSGEIPFSQAIVSSPGLMPRRDVRSRRHDMYEAILEAANCTSISCLRSVSEGVLSEANHYLISDVPAGAGGGSYGPGIGFSAFPDDDLIPDNPMVLLEQGDYHGGKQVISSHMALEGKTISSDDNMPQAFPDLVRMVFPTASNATIDEIMSLFPYPADNPAKLAWDWTASIAYACNALSIAKAYEDKGRRYVMSVPPATHGTDLFHIFFINNETTPVADIEIAQQTQQYMVKFISDYESDDPLGSPPGDLPEWPAYGAEFNTMDIGLEGFSILEDESKDVCSTLLEMIKDPANGN